MYRRTSRNPSSSVQFENENDVTPSVINMFIFIFIFIIFIFICSYTMLSYLLSVLEYNINLPE